MTKTTLERIAACEKELAELRRIAEGEQEWPKMGDKYWTSDTIYGKVLFCVWNNDSCDQYRLKIGNCKRTYEEAKAHHQWLLAWVKWRKLTQHFVPDWGNTDQKKWFPFYDFRLKKIGTAYRTCSHFGIPPLPSEQELESAIKEMGPELMNALLGVKE